jgi:DNA-binding SARP family transcriptional activator
VSIRIRLLGQPTIEVDGRTERSLPGWKPWALLAHLVLSDQPASRQRLSELLWPEAEDPSGALRWALFQLRKALAPEATVVERGGRLELAEPKPAVDVLELLEGSVAKDGVEDLARGGLLDGLHFGGAPGFELWLGIERARVESALQSTLRWAATLSAADDPDRALRLTERTLALDPFDDAAHELAIEIHMLRGDRRAARAHLDRVTRLYRQELGSGAPDRLRRPLERTTGQGPNPMIDRAVSSRAILDVARARLDGGDYDAAIASARRAVQEAVAGGEAVAEARALAVLAEALIHGRRGLDDEAVGLLDRALRLAMDAGVLDLAADIEREGGYVAFLAADYGAAETALRRSLALARRSGDQRRVGRALTLLAACRSDEGAPGAAEALITDALTALEAAGDRRWHAYATTFLARVMLEADRPHDARTAAERALAEARASGWTALVPFPMAQVGLSLLGMGQAAPAHATFGEALTMAEEIGDPCWEALALRGLGLVASAGGQGQEARAFLVEALARCRRVPDTYRWAEISILTDLAELGAGTDRGHRDDARRLAHRAGMAHIIRRLDAVDRQTPPQTPAP